MQTQLLKKLKQKVDNLERQLEKVRKSVNSRSNLDIPTDASIVRVKAGEAISERYAIVKIVHNDGGVNQNAKAVIFGSSHPDNDLPNFVVGIALSTASSGDHFLVKIDGSSFALTVASSSAYGADDQIKAGDKLYIDSTPGFLQRGDSNTINYFVALESRHPGEEVLRVKFAIPDQNNSESNRSFIVDIISFFGGQTYFGNLYSTDPTSGDLVIVETNITVKAIDDVAMVGIITPGLKYLAHRSINLGNENNPFYFYYIQPTRVE